MIKMAFSTAVGVLQASHRAVGARAVVMHAALALQERAAATAVAESKARWLLLQREFNETPVHVGFGHLAELIAPTARYAVPGEVAAMLGRPLCSYQECMLYGVPRTQHGVVDVWHKP